MLSHVRKRMFEIGISSMLSHRLAKKIVQEGIRIDTPSYHTICENFIAECRLIMLHDFELPEQQVNRILQFVIAQAESEVVFFETHGKFNNDGADQVRLEVMLAIKIEQLKAM